MKTLFRVFLLAVVAATSHSSFSSFSCSQVLAARSKPHTPRFRFDVLLQRGRVTAWFAAAEQSASLDRFVLWPAVFLIVSIVGVRSFNTQGGGIPLLLPGASCRSHSLWPLKLHRCRAFRLCPHGSALSQNSGSLPFVIAVFRTGSKASLASAGGQHDSLTQRFQRTPLRSPLNALR